MIQFEQHKINSCIFYTNLRNSSYIYMQPNDCFLVEKCKITLFSRDTYNFL